MSRLLPLPCTGSRAAEGALAMTMLYSIMPLPSRARAVSSAGEHFLDMEGVSGSIPLPPTSLARLEALRLAGRPSVLRREGVRPPPRGEGEPALFRAASAGRPGASARRAGNKREPG